MNVQQVGDGKVVLIAGGGKIYTDIAARFVGSEKALEDIIASPYSKEVVSKVLNSGHRAAIEFDYFLFGLEGYARVTEIQLVRKRIASYLIKSGRVNKGGKRSFDVVLPKSISRHKATLVIPPELLHTTDGVPLSECLNNIGPILYDYGVDEMVELVEHWYNSGIDAGLPEEDLRYLKPQATEFKAIIGMNAHALYDWFGVRCCKRAQLEIRDLATKMLKLVKEASPDLFAEAGPNCKLLGYCPENDMQHVDCRHRIMTKKAAFKLIQDSQGLGE